MIEKIKDLVARVWPRLRLRTILFGVLLFAAAMPAIGAISLRVFENTLVRQTEAELVAQGAALAAVAAVTWPGAPVYVPRPAKPSTDYYRPEFTTIDLSRDQILPERPPPRPAATDQCMDVEHVGETMRPVIETTQRTTLASVIITNRDGIVCYGEGFDGDYSWLPEVRAALAGHSRTVLRVNGDYHPLYRFEWLSKAAGLRLHHARPIVVAGKVEGVLLLSRSPRALFRGIYEDRAKFALAAVVILSLLVLLAGLVSRGVTRPIEKLSRASREVAAGGGDIPRTPRTAAVEVRDLYEDFRAMAERIERRSGYLRDFAAAVSHEFKTPLAGINGAVELLQDHFDTMSEPERRRFLDNIQGDSERLSKLVTRLLDLARADMATLAPGVTCDVAGTLRCATESEAREGFAIASFLPDDLPPASVPAGTLETALAVLFQNSRQAGARIATVRATASADEIQIVVRDDGPGIADADRARLFDPFFTSRRAEGGTGLGLPIARSLLAASQARINLLASDTGAAFRIVLPRG